MENRWSKKDIEDFEKLCQPIVKWLSEKGAIMGTVIITVDYCKVVTDEIGVPFQLTKDS